MVDIKNKHQTSTYSNNVSFERMSKRVQEYLAKSLYNSSMKDLSEKQQYRIKKIVNKRLKHFYKEQNKKLQQQEKDELKIQKRLDEGINKILPTTKKNKGLHKVVKKKTTKDKSKRRKRIKTWLFGLAALFIGGITFSSSSEDFGNAGTFASKEPDFVSVYEEYIENEGERASEPIDDSDEVEETLEIPSAYQSATKDNKQFVQLVERPVIKYEYIDTSYFEDSDYKFNSNITVDFLKESNPELSDSLAYIEINGTRVSYPIALPSESKIDEVDGLRNEIEGSNIPTETYLNSYYLHKDLDGKDSKYGTIYTDVHNDGLNSHFDELDDHTVIYGHNMKNGSMFHDIAYWKNDSKGKYNSKHPYAIIYTDDGYGYILKFIASRVISGTRYDLLHPGDFESVEEKQKYIKGIHDEAKENGWFAVDEYEVDEDDKLISLVTCVYDYDNARIQLIGEVEGKIKVSDLTKSEFKDGYNYVEKSTLNR